MDYLRQFSSRDAAKWMLGLGVELEDGTIDWYQFRENTILYSISTLWNDETENLIKGIFTDIKEILKSLTEVFDDKQNKLYLENLNYTHFNTKLISYDNFSNYANDSKITYEINYKNAGVNNTYLDKLILSGARKKAIEPKYNIKYFETK